MTIIENDHFLIRFDEHRGGSITAAFVKHRDQLLAIMPDTGHPDCDLSLSSWIMAPYSNRIMDGTFSFGGKDFQLRGAREHSIHGDVWHRAWRIIRHDNSRLLLSFNSGDFDDVNWPWEFTVTAEYRLIANRFGSLLRLTNTSTELMPAGLGWHPYFNRSLTELDEELFLQVNVAGVYPDANDNRMPSGPVRPLSEDEDFRVGRAVSRHELVDACFYGYNGNGQLYWPGTGLKLNFECGGPCRHLVIYTPLGKPYIAFEPVTHANNGINLLAAGDSASGIVTLRPGESLEVSFAMVARWD